jgi:flagellar biosynthesis protein FlhG
MIDQAAELRRLMLSGRADPGGTLPRTFVISGGKPGVGATTLAVNLAATLAHDAQRVVLVDADLNHAEVAAECGVTASFDIGDVLAGRKNIHEALARGPAGMQVLAGAASDEVRASATPRNLNRLLRQLQSVAPHADWVLVDAGNQPGEIAGRLWAAAEHVLLVTSPEAAAVMDTYALVKTLLKRQSLAAPLALVVNQAADEAEAADVCRRIDQSCRRFLGLSVPLAGWLPCDSQILPADAREQPTVLEQSDGPLAGAIHHLAEFVIGAHRAATLPQRLAA